MRKSQRLGADGWMDVNTRATSEKCEAVFGQKLRKKKIRADRRFDRIALCSGKKGKANGSL